MSNEPTGTVAAAPLIVGWLGAAGCVEAVCCSAGAGAASVFGRIAPGFVAAVAVCLAGCFLSSFGLDVVLVALAFGAGADFSSLDEPPRPTMRAMRSIMPPPDEDDGEEDDELLLDEDENILLKKPPEADAVSVFASARTTGSETLPVVVGRDDEAVAVRVARSPLGGVRMLAGMVPAEVEVRVRTTPSSSTLCDCRAEANVGCMPPSAKLRTAGRLVPRRIRSATCASSRRVLSCTAARTSSGVVMAGQAAVET